MFLILHSQWEIIEDISGGGTDKQFAKSFKRNSKKKRIGRKHKKKTSETPVHEKGKKMSHCENVRVLFKAVFCPQVLLII